LTWFASRSQDQDAGEYYCIRRRNRPGIAGRARREFEMVGEGSPVGVSLVGTVVNRTRHALQRVAHSGLASPDPRANGRDNSSTLFR
jgi:hypothetical protein